MDEPVAPVVWEVVDAATVAVRIHVQLGAGRERVVGRYGDALKVAVVAPPERGRANDAVCRLLADALGVPARCVRVASGATGRRKRVLVTTDDPAGVGARLDSLLIG